jgi:O-antigen ligase
MLLFFGAGLIGRALRRGLPARDLIKPSPALLALIVAALYAGLSAVWGADPLAALSKAALLLSVTLVAAASFASLTMLERDEAAWAAKAFLAGSLCGSVFVLIELLTAGALTRFTMNWVAAFRPDRFKHMKVSDGFVKRINTSEFNQNVAILAFQIWAGLLAIFALETGRRRTIIASLYFCTLAATIAVSKHDSSQVGVVAGLAVLLLAWTWPRQVVTGLAAAWCLGFVLVLPLDFLAFKADLHQADWLPRSARARIIIWEYTAEQVLTRPILGIGADSTPAVKNMRTTTPEQPDGFVYKRTTGQHAHNVFLQTWYELGIIGAILFAIAGAALVFRILVLPRGAQAFAAAAFMTFCAVAAFAWGVWQVWLVAAVGFIPIYLGIGARLLRPEPD